MSERIECQRFQERHLPDLPADDADASWLWQHRESCPACQRLARRQQQVADLLRQQSRVTPQQSSLRSFAEARRAWESRSDAELRRVETKLRPLLASLERAVAPGSVREAVLRRLGWRRPARWIVLKQAAGIAATLIFATVLWNAPWFRADPPASDSIAFGEPLAESVQLNVIDVRGLSLSEITASDLAVLKRRFAPQVPALIWREDGPR